MPSAEYESREAAQGGGPLAAASAREVVGLVGQAALGLTGVVRDTHAAIARRSYGRWGRVGRAPRQLHDAVATISYGAVAAGLRLTAALAGGLVPAVVARRATNRSRTGFAASPAPSRGGSALALSALNAAIGDALHSRGSVLEVRMGLRHEGRDVPRTRAGLARAYPDGRPAVAVFLHGLGENDLSWRHDALRRWGDGAATHGSRLASVLGVTPVFLRYNTGRPVAENGAELDQLLGELVACWPVPLTRLVLIGHSMGGLVMRAACRQAEEVGTAAAPRGWWPLMDTAIYLGTPHQGAALARLADTGERLLSTFPETAALGRIIALRSAGITDLCHGSAASLSPGTRHLFVAATVTRRTDTATARLLGDWLVRPDSAAGPRCAAPPHLEPCAVLGGLHHFDLLNHPRVSEQLQTWLAAGPPATVPGRRQ